METFKKAKVVIETTKKKSKIAICYNVNKEGTLKEADMQFPHINQGLGVFIGGGRKTSYQAMYITTDEKIAKNDWYLSYINGEFNGVFQAETGIDKCTENRTWREDCVKIIATNNVELLECSTIPTISRPFVRKFIESYNEGKPITDVLVLYKNLDFKLATYGKFKTLNKKIETSKTIIHIDKENCITIKKPQTQFSRDELKQYMWQAYKESNTVFTDELALREEFEEFTKNILI